MNKKTIIIIGIILSLTIIVEYANYSASVFHYFSKVSDETYEISKSSNESNQEFITEITKFAIANNVSFYENLFTYTGDDETGVSTYYVTKNFKLDQKFINSDKLPVDNYQNHELKIPTMYFKYEVKNFTDFASDNPNTNQIVISVHGKKDDIDKFISNVSKIYAVKKQQSAIIEHQPKLVLMYVILYIVFLLSILFDEKSQQKKYNLQKMFGYSNLEILKQETITVIKAILGLWLIILVIFGVIISLTTNLYGYFLIYIFKPLFIMYLLLTITILIVKYNVLKNKVSYLAIKGFKVTKLEKVFLNVAKVIILVILIASSVGLISQISQLKTNINQLDENKEKFKGYVQLPFVTSGVAYTEELDHEMSKDSVVLYHNTVASNEGIFIDSNSFIPNAEEVGDVDELLYTNKNYLNIQDIYANGDKLTKSQLEVSDIVVLYPETKSLKSVSEIVKRNCEEIKDSDISYLKYDENQSLDTYNSAVNTKGNKVDDPIVIVANKMTKEQEEQAFWSNYIIKDDNLDKILAKYDQYNFVQKPEYVNKIFSEQLVDLQNALKKSVLSIIICTTIIVLIILFKINNYILENQKEIYIKKTLGYSSIMNFRPLFISNLGLYMAISIILFIGLNMTNALLMFVLILMIDFGLMYLCILNKERKSNANQIRKN